MNIHDGPGELAQILNSTFGNGTTLTTSTFQCLIKISQFSSKLSGIDLTAIRSSLVRKLSLSDHLVYNFSEKLFRKNIGYVLLKPGENLSLNISVHLEYIGKLPVHYNLNLLSLQCTYGGLVTLNEMEEDQITLCDNYTFYGQERYVYVTKPSFMVFYFYPGYSEVRAILNISTTRCTVVHLNTCFDQVLCPFKHWTTTCASFLENITKEGNSRLSYDTSSEDWLIPATIFSVKTNECLTLQIQNKKTVGQHFPKPRFSILFRDRIGLLWLLEIFWNMKNCFSFFMDLLNHTHNKLLKVIIET